MMQLWLQEVQCYQKAFSPSFLQNIANISFACMAKSKHLLQGLFPVTLIGDAGSRRSSKWGNSLSLMQKEALQKQNTNRARHRLLTDLSLLPELAWNLSPVRQHFPLFTDLIERMIYQGSASHWVLLSAPKGNELRHISFSFPMWLWGCWRRWEPAGFGVTHGQFCCEGLLLLAPGPACSPHFPQDRVCCVCQEVAGSCTKTSKAQVWQRGSGMGNDSRKDNDSGNKRVRNTRKWKDSLLLSLLLSLLSLGTMAWCCWTLLWLTTQSHHSTVGTNTFSLSGYLFWLWGVFLKQRWYLFQSQQNPSSHLNLQSHN